MLWLEHYECAMLKLLENKFEVCVCVCVPVGVEAEWVDQKGDRSAANKSGIWKGESYSYCFVASLAILVNHTPIERVKICVIFLLGASTLTSVCHWLRTRVSQLAH